MFIQKIVDFCSLFYIRFFLAIVVEGGSNIHEFLLIMELYREATNMERVWSFEYSNLFLRQQKPIILNV